MYQAGLRGVGMAVRKVLHFASMGLHDVGPFKHVFQVTGHSEVMQGKFEVKREN
jgi:hypothetical protein